MGLENLSTVFNDLSQNSSETADPALNLLGAGGNLDLETLAPLSEYNDLTTNSNIRINPSLALGNNPSKTFSDPLGSGNYTLEQLFDPTHGSNYDTRSVFLRSGMGKTDNLDIRKNATLFTTGVGGLKEPYIVNRIGSATNLVGNNRDLLPWRAAADDVVRFIAYNSSPKGLLALLKENVTNFAIGEGVPIDNPLSAIMAPPLPIPNTGFLNFIQQNVQGRSLIPGGGSARKPFKVQYSSRARVGGFPFKNLGDRPIGIEQLARIKLPQGDNFFSKLARKALKPIRDEGIRQLAKLAQLPKVEKPSPFTDLRGGGKDTSYVDLFSLNPEIDEGELSLYEPNIKKGDFYVKIKDLRNNTFLFFRGFVTGIVETVTPSFGAQTFIGRSEDVYVYNKGERSMSFNLKVYPQNSTEQLNMYKKLELLTSLAYPQYQAEENDQAMFRMKAPFTELYMAHIGTRKKGQFGFISQLTYTVPDETDWDSERSLPRMFDIAFEYQILNKKPPALGSNFYGAYK